MFAASGLRFSVFLTLFYSVVYAEKRFILNNIIPTQDRLVNLEAQIVNLSAENTKFQALLETFLGQVSSVAPVTGGPAGAVFTIWGSLNCPNNTDTVYTGFAGGSHSNHAGAAPDALCLPDDPIMGDITTRPPYYGFVYGAEYITTFFGKQLQYANVPCSVCVSHNEYHVLMLPGRNKCYDGWTEQYRGYLSGNYYAYKGSSNFVCMNEHADVIPGGQANQGGKGFYGVISTCGTLLCPPYNESVPLTCAVCTK